MALDQMEQIQKLIADKKNILVAFGKNQSGDAIASATAFLLFLEKLGKPADAVSENFNLPKNYRFLKRSNKVKPQIADLQKFIITLDVKETGLNELSYDLKDEKLRIFISPKQGFLTRDHIRTAQSDFKYDLIITLNTPDLKSLGGVYENNTELFFKTPLINIDNESANEHYGHINMVDITAASTAEVVYEVFKQIGPEYIDENIATALLTGMIAKTHSFKTTNTKPHTLATASELIGLGANRDKIIHFLYRTRSIATLKLWGDALSNLNFDNEAKLVWTTITRDNFVRSGADETDLYDVVDEIISTTPEAELILIIHEHATGTNQTGAHIILHTNDNIHDAKKILSTYHPEVNGDKKRATCLVTDKALKQVETEIIAHIKQFVR